MSTLRCGVNFSASAAQLGTTEVGAMTSEGSPGFFARLGGEVGEGLEGFAEAHVVGENAVQPVGGEKLQPAESFELIVAQFGADAWRELPPAAAR